MFLNLYIQFSLTTDWLSRISVIWLTESQNVDSVKCLRGGSPQLTVFWRFTSPSLQIGVSDLHVLTDLYLCDCVWAWELQ